MLDASPRVDVRWALVVSGILLWGWLGGGVVQADEVPYRHFTTFDGLPSERITALDQSPSGLLWIGTNTGLAVYDGHEFRQISLPDTIGVPYVSSIRAMPDGSVWVAASRGQAVKVRLTGVVQVVDLDFQFVRQILVPGDTALFVTDNTIWRLAPGSKKADPQPLSFEKGRIKGYPNGVVGADLGPHGELWVVHPHRGPGRVGTDGMITFLDIPTASRRSGWEQIRFASDGTTAAIKDETLYQIDLDARDIEPVVDSVATTENLAVEGTTAYVSRKKTLHRYDLSTGELRSTLGPKQGLPQTTLAAVLQTQGGGLWVGTHNGLLYLSNVNSRVTGVIDGAPVQDVMQFMTREDALWIRTIESGLIRVRPVPGRERPGGLRKWRELSSLNEALHVIAANTEEWYRWRKETGWQRVRSASGVVTELVESDGFVSPSGVGIFKREDGLFLYPSRANAEPVPLVRWPDSLNYLHNVAPAPNGDIIHRAKEHVFRRDSNGSILDTIGTVPDNDEPDDGDLSVDPYSNMRHMSVDASGRVWCAFSYDGGLLRVDPTTGTRRVIMKDRRVWRADVAGDSLVFASTRQNGLYVVNAQSGTIRRRLTRTDGLKSMTVFTAHLTNDTLYVGHTNGISRLPTEGLLKVPRSPITLLTGIESDFGKQSHMTDSLLTSGDRSLGFSYTAPELTHPERVRYEVRLEPHDAEWQTTQRDFTRYTDLDPGTYRFEVRARLGDAPPGPTATYAFTIPPHFYETWWFQIAVLLGLLGVGIAAYRWRTNRLRRRQEKLKDAVETRTQELQERTEELAAEKRKTEAQTERLAELDDAKNRFFAHISHEFRTPLALILTPLEEVLRETTTETVSFGTEQVQRMVHNARRLQRLIEQLLDLATLEAGRMELDPQLGDLGTVVRRAVEAFSTRAERNGIDLRVRTSGHALKARFDPEKIESIVNNLVSNALKFTPEGGRVTVWIGERKTPRRAEEGRAREAIIKVADTGPGMDAETQSRIFERFEQVEAPDTREHEGAGLGLALTKELVELHGGRIDVVSTPGEGTTFTVTVPVASAPENDRASTGDRAFEQPDASPLSSTVHSSSPRVGDAEAARGPVTGDGAPSEVDRDSRRDTVLVVEDNAEMRTYLREQLSDRWRVLAAADGEEGWQVVQDEELDLVLSDVMMPGLTGYELCEKIKEDRALRDVPVLLLTARAETEDAIEGLDCGADDYLAKPFDLDELRGRIANLLAARRRLRDRYQQEVRLEALDTVVDEEEVSLLEAVTEAVEAHLEDPGFTVEQLAQAVALSPRQFTRRLKSAIGKTPAAFVRERRIERAKEMLEREPETIAEVAYAVGFRSASAFSKTFREHVGVSPSEYVEQQVD